jgi:hypothetical protein
MRLLARLKVLHDFLGFLLASTGGTLSAIGILLLMARVGMGHSDPGYAVEWLALFVITGVSGTIMLGGGVLLVRKSRQD